MRGQDQGGPHMMWSVAWCKVWCKAWCMTPSQWGLTGKNWVLTKPPYKLVMTATRTQETPGSPDRNLFYSRTSISLNYVPTLSFAHWNIKYSIEFHCKILKSLPLVLISVSTTQSRTVLILPVKAAFRFGAFFFHKLLWVFMYNVRFLGELKLPIIMDPSEDEQSY